MRATSIYCLSLLAVAGMFGGEAVAANIYWPCQPCPPTYSAQPSTVPSEGATTSPTAPSEGAVPAGNANAAAGENAPNASGLGETPSYNESNSITVAGVGLTGATATGGPAAGTYTVSNALILPGLLTAATAESPLPQNRIFFDYSYFDQFQVVTTTSLIAVPTGNGGLTAVGNTTQAAGFNLNCFDVGFEKTICNGDGSIYARLPFLYADDNVSNANINGVGDFSVGFKYIVLQNEQNGDTLSAGLTVATPTAQAGQFVVSGTGAFNSTSPGGTATLKMQTLESVNPVFLQPWVGGVMTRDRFILQDYCGVLVPLTNQIVPALNNNISVGYRLWDGNGQECRITSVTPTFAAQALVPLGNSGSPFPISFPTQVFLTEGFQVGVGPRLSIFGGVVEPVVGPTAFCVGATSGVNIAF